MSYKLRACAHLLPFLILFSACDFGGEKKRTAPRGDDSVIVLPYFVSTRWALNLLDASGKRTDVDIALSTFSGQTLVASLDSSFSNWISPPMGTCMFSSQDGVQVSAKRALDIGDLTLRGAGIGQMTIAHGESPNFSFSVGGNMALKLGESYQLETSGVNGQMNWQQDFTVLPAASNITITPVVDLNDQQQKKTRTVTLPTPNEMNDTQIDYYAVIDKTKGITLGYTAPAGTTYVKAQFSDGSQEPESNITCYGAPGGTIAVPEGAFAHFKTTNDGLLKLDFIAISERRDIPKVKSSVVISATRHVHGRMDFNLDGQKIPHFFGMMRFQPPVQ